MKRKSKNLILGMFLLTGIANLGKADITNGLTGHWTFDETSGTTAKDTSGQNNNGAVGNANGDAPGWTSGQIGGALAFRGPDAGGDYVIVSRYFQATNTFSISAWVFADPRDGTWPKARSTTWGFGAPP